MDHNGILGTASRVGLIFLLAAGLAACGRVATGPDRAPGAAPGPAEASGPIAPEPPTRPESSAFEYRYTSVRIADPGAVLYRAVFRFHPDGTLRAAELREIRGGAESLRASSVSEPVAGGYKVSYRSFGPDPVGYEYVLGWGGTGLTVTAGGEATGFRFDPADRVFTIPWDRGAETYAPGPAGSVLAELVLSGRREWNGRLFKSEGSLRFEDRYPDGSVDRECVLKPAGPETWTVSCTGAADSYFEGTLTGASLFPRGGTYPGSVFNLVILTDLWMTEERLPFFCLSLLE